MFSFSAQFLSQIVHLALDIARIRRNENHLQDPGTLYTKFNQELVELEEAEYPEDELPDVAYYALCLAAQGENYCLSRLENEILPQYGYSQAQIERMTSAKYARRAAGHPKDIEAERAAIRAAMR